MESLRLNSRDRTQQQRIVGPEVLALNCEGDCVAPASHFRPDIELADPLPDWIAVGPGVRTRKARFSKLTQDLHLKREVGIRLDERFEICGCDCVRFQLFAHDVRSLRLDNTLLGLTRGRRRDPRWWSLRHHCIVRGLRDGSGASHELTDWNGPIQEGCPRSYGDFGLNRVVIRAEPLACRLQKSSGGQGMDIRMDIAVVAPQRFRQGPHAAYVMAANVAQ